jgi:membrane protein required for colicin V production
MNVDLFVGGFVLLFAIWGFFTGASRQIAQYVALFVAWLAAPSAGQFVGGFLAQRLGGSLTVGQIIGTGIAFLLIFFPVRLLVAAIVRRFLNAGATRSSMTDRLLGALLSAGRMAVFAYLLLCGVIFLENSFSLFGKRIKIPSQNSVVFQFVRENNVLLWQQFSGINDFVALLKMKADPSQLAKIQSKADYTALMQNERFLKALKADGIEKALAGGEVRSLLQNNDVVELIQDGALMRRIERLTGSNL